MTEQDIIERLRAGWQLSNRGAGWYLSSPQVRGRPKEQTLIPDEVVSGMVRSGVIKTTIPYTSIHAELVEGGEQA